MEAVTLHAVVIAWKGKEQAARHIAAELLQACERLTVVYSNPWNRHEQGRGDWVQVDDAWFFGRKFQVSLEQRNELPGRHEVMLQVQADAHCDDWIGLASACRLAFSRHADLGVWAPDIDHTPYCGPSALIGTPPTADGLEHVAQTDAIVWALSPQVQRRLARLDYEPNNLGWGIDWAAIAYAHCHGLQVLRDPAQRVLHPRGSGYDARLARRQQEAFLAQLEPKERAALQLLRTHLRRYGEVSTQELLSELMWRLRARWRRAQARATSLAA